jgi:CHAD domain-containing protein
MPIAELSQTRQRRHIVGAASPDHPLAELSIDRTDVYGPHDRPRMQPDGRAVAEFNEAEIELLDPAADAALHDLVAVAAAEFDLTPEPASKLERSLLAIGAHSPGSPPNQTGIVPDMHMADACRLIWREQLVRLICLEHGARLGVDPEYVHEMRVAIRRARAAGRLFGEYFRAKDLRRQMRGLRRLGRVLGAVRDLDVGIENLSLFRKSLPKGQRSGIKRLIQDLEEQRVAARMALLEYLDSPEHAKFVAGFDRFCRTAGAGVRPQDLVAQEVAPVQVRHTMPSIILAHFEAVRAYEVLFDVDPAPAEPAPVATLHALRIEAKYLRYSLEFVRHLLGAEGEKLIAQLKTLQDHLGDLNDADVERGRLFAMEGPLRSQQAVALRLEALEKVISHLREQAPARLDRFVAPTNRRRLAIAIARL